jgi:replicative DNA helicase
MSNTYKSAKEIIPEVISGIEKKSIDRGLLLGIPTGFRVLDNCTDGFQPSNLIVIGSRPGMGKTSFTLSIVADMTVSRKIPVAWFSPDMSDTNLIERLMSILSEIKIKKLRSGSLTTAEFGKLNNAAELICEAPLFVVDESHIPLSRLVSQARELRFKHKIEIIFIDDLSQINAEQQWFVSRTLKDLAHELQIPVVVVSQLTRDFEGRRPDLTALKKSGTLEEDADLVLFLYNDRGIWGRPKIADNNEKFESLTELVIAKNNNGTTGVVNMLFHPQYGKFDEFKNVEEGAS